jgi:hypothetical protein
MRRDFVYRESYLESLDPVRFAPSIPPEEREERLVHLRLEILLSLLLGQRVLIPEPYSFDSLGFIAIASEVIQARDRAISGNLQATLFLQRTPVFIPFELRLVSTEPGPQAFVSMVLRRIADPNFILSSIPEFTVTDENEAAIRAQRAGISEAIGREGFGALRAHLPVERADLPEYLDFVQSYFSSPQARGRLPLGKTTPPGVSLPQYIQWIRGPAGLRSLPDPLHGAATHLIEAFERLDGVGIPNTDRSRIRLYGRTRANLDDDLHDLAVEFVDSSYNRVLGSAMNADFRSHNTGLRVTDPVVREAEAISKLGHAYLSNTRATWENMDLVIAPAKELVETLSVSRNNFDDESIADLKSWKTWTNIWDRLWEVASDVGWLERVDRLHRALGSHEGEDRLSETDEALDDLIAYVAHQLRPLQIQRRGTGIVRVVAMAIPVAKLAVYTWAVPRAAKDTVDLAKAALDLVRASREYPKTVFSRGSIERSVRIT